MFCQCHFSGQPWNFFLNWKKKRSTFSQPLFRVLTGPLGILVQFFTVPVTEVGFLAAFLPLHVHVLQSTRSASLPCLGNDIYSSWAIPGGENDGLKLRSYFADPCVLNFPEWQKSISAGIPCCLSPLTKLSDRKAKLVQRKMPRDNSQDLCQNHVWWMGGEWHWRWITEVGVLEMKPHKIVGVGCFAAVAVPQRHLSLVYTPCPF